MNIWQFQNLISRRLLRWGGASIALGIMMRFGGKFWKNAGNQFIAWGAIDALIAIFGQVAARNRIDSYENPATPEIKRKEERTLSKILWINAGLDVLYIIGGWLWTRRDKGDGTARGNGVAVMIQGAFLLIFDVIHALIIPQTSSDD